MKKVFALIIGSLLSLLFPRIGEDDGGSFSPAPREEISVDQPVEYQAASSLPEIESEMVFEISVSEIDSQGCIIPADLSVFDASSRAVFESALSKVPCELMETLQTIEIVDDSEMPRALAGKYTIKFRSDSPKKAEFESLTLHEFGHIVDLGGLRGTSDSGKSEFVDGSLPIFNDDLSVQFYRISWETSEVKKNSALDEDFASGYGASNAFEDFAECFLFYRLHGKTFKSLTLENNALKLKYEFMKNNVFDGEEFSTGDENLAMTPRPWDVTKLPVSSPAL